MKRTAGPIKQVGQLDVTDDMTHIFIGPKLYLHDRHRLAYYNIVRRYGIVGQDVFTLTSASASRRDVAVP